MSLSSSEPPASSASSASPASPASATSARDWYEETRRHTIALVRLRSVSPSPQENEVAEAIVRLLGADGLADAYTALGLERIPGDPWGRANAFAFVRGRSAQTVTLLGHFDTVDTVDYGALEPWALDPDGLRERLDALARLVPGLREDEAEAPGDWMYGRGVADMKSGVAICITLMRHYARLARAGALPLSVVMIATPDEENESAGAREAARLLARLRAEHRLTLAGAINTDYVSARYPGDRQRPIYTGSVGKLLPCFYIVGQASHAGEPFAGLDANLLQAELITELSMNTAYCETVRGQTTPPPITLRATDTKAVYNTQLPFSAYVYINLLTLERTPEQALEQLREGAWRALNRTLERVSVAEQQWTVLHGAPPTGLNARRAGSVVTWAELRAEVAARQGEAALASALAEEWARWPAETDKRERSVRLVECLWTLSERAGPAIVLFFAPPYYPAVPAVPSPLLDALRETLAAHPDERLVEEEFFPLLSDMSYLRLDPSVDATALCENMPVWRDAAAATPGGYHVPLEEMRSLDMPVINIGPYGRDLHQRGERALMSFSFATAPRVIDETIIRLAHLLADEPDVSSDV
ncbi:MAG TPA: M20/M25/M40 family metallo-hydrolase [Ktedonobacterales bacterium]|nr:M20/M25/M40 family metallo-hydrolase [Ktedonobacterales bacterium]